MKRFSKEECALLADYLDRLQVAQIAELRIFIKSLRMDPSTPDYAWVRFDYIHPVSYILTTYGYGDGTGVAKEASVALWEISEEVLAAYRTDVSSVVGLPAVAAWNGIYSMLSNLRITDVGRQHLRRPIGGTIRRGDLLYMKRPKGLRSTEAGGPSVTYYELHIREKPDDTSYAIYYAKEADIDPRVTAMYGGGSLAQVFDAHYDEVEINRAVYYLVHGETTFHGRTPPKGFVDRPRALAVRPVFSSEYSTILYKSQDKFGWPSPYEEHKDELYAPRMADELGMAPAYRALPGEPYEFSVDYVIDGDTIKVTELLSAKHAARYPNADVLAEFKKFFPDREEANSLRLAGINAPEWKTRLGRKDWEMQEGGAAALQFLESMVAMGDGVVYFLHERNLGYGGYDEYGRPLGEVFIRALVDGEYWYYNLGLMLLAHGYVDPFIFLRHGVWDTIYAKKEEYESYADQRRKDSEKRWWFGYDEQNVIDVCQVPAEFAQFNDLDAVHGKLPPHGMRIGDVQLVIPPTAIRVNRSADTLRLPLLRNATAIKKTTGYTHTVIELDLYFHDAKSINGRHYVDAKLRKAVGRVPEVGAIAETAGDYYIDGLRALVAQFKRVPFLPIENELLNEAYQVTAVTLLSLNISTVPGFPNSLHAQLKLLPFNHRIFLPDCPLLSGSIIWPLFRHYYQQAILPESKMLRSDERLPADGKLRLYPVPESGMRPSFTLYAATEEKAAKVAGAKSAKSQVGYVMAGNRAATDMQKKYTVWWLLDNAFKCKQAWLETRDEEKYADWIVQRNNNTIDRYTLLHIMRGYQYKPSGRGGNQGYRPATPKIEAAADSESVYRYYRAIGYFPRYNPDGWLHGDPKVEVPLQYLAVPGLDQYPAGPVYILELNDTMYADMPGVIRLFLYNEKTKLYTYSPFCLIPESYIAGIAEKSMDPVKWRKTLDDEIRSAETELTLDRKFIPDAHDLIVTSISVGMNNIVVDMSTTGEEYGAHQYLGCMDTSVRVVFETVNVNALQQLNDLVAHVNRLSRQYRHGMEAGFLHIHNDLLQLCGVSSVVVDSISSATVEGQPGLYRIELILSSFDRVQREAEELDALMREDEELFSLEPRGSSDRFTFFRTIESRMRERSAYPDLELPTYEEVNDLLWALQIAHGYASVDGKKYRIQPNRSYEGWLCMHVDPDFYVSRSITFKQTIMSMLQADMNLDLLSLTTGQKDQMKSATRTYKDIMPLARSAQKAARAQGVIDAEKLSSKIGLPVSLDSRPPIAGCNDRAHFDSHERSIPPQGDKVKVYLRLYTAHTTESNPDGLLFPSKRQGESGKFYKPLHTAKAPSSLFPLGTIIRVCDKAGQKIYQSMPNYGYYVIEEHTAANDTIPVSAKDPDVSKGAEFPVVGIFVAQLDDAFAVVGREPVEIEVMGKVSFDPARQDHEDCRESFNAQMPCAVRKYMTDLLQQGEIAEAAGTGKYIGIPAEPVRSSLVDMFEYDCRGRLLRAFPTYQLYFVDEGRWVNKWRLMDNYYGLNAVLSIDLYNSRKTAASTCVIHLGNTYGHLTTLQYRDAIPSKAPGLFWEFFKVGPSDPSFMSLLAHRAQSIESMFMRPGARIHLRMGYGSDISALPVVFNGSVTEFVPGDIVRIVAQGDGIELTRQAGSGVKQAEPRDRIGELMMGDMSGIDKTKYGATEGVWDPRENPITHFGETFFYDPGWSYAIGEMMQNVYVGAHVARLQEAPEGQIEAVAWLQSAGAWILRKFGLDIEVADYTDELNVGMNETGKTVWDVVQTYAACLSDYVAAVVPFENRSTLFYGRPNWLLRYRYTPDGKMLQKTFWQTRLYHSATDILSNGIYVSADGVYNNVRLRYNLNAKKKDEGGGASYVVHADTNIVPEEQRTAVVVSDLVLGVPVAKSLPGLGSLLKSYWELAAHNYATACLVAFLKDMYKGPLVVIGDPTVKPHDPCYLFDQYRQMHGLFQVKEVAHHMSQETGFITSIVPDCCVAAADGEMAKQWCALGAIGGYALWGWTVVTVATSIWANLFHEAVIGKAVAAGVQTAAAGADLVTRFKLFCTNLKPRVGQFLSAEVGAGFWCNLGVHVLVTVIVIALVESVSRYVKLRARARQAVVVAPLRLHNQNLSVLLKGSKGAVVGTMASDADNNWSKVASYFGHSIDYQYKVDPTNVDWYSLDDILARMEKATEGQDLQIKWESSAVDLPQQSARTSPHMPFRTLVAEPPFGPGSVGGVDLPTNMVRYWADMKFLEDELAKAATSSGGHLRDWDEVFYWAGHSTSKGSSPQHVLCRMTLEDAVCFLAMMYEECGNQPAYGKQAVASVIWNRVYVNHAHLTTGDMRYMEQTPGLSPLRIILYQRSGGWEFSPLYKDKVSDDDRKKGDLRTGWQKALSRAVAPARTFTNDKCMQAIVDALMMKEPTYYPEIMHALYFGNRDFAETKWMWNNPSLYVCPKKDKDLYKKLYGDHDFAVMAEAERARNPRLYPHRPGIDVPYRR